MYTFFAVGTFLESYSEIYNRERLVICSQLSRYKRRDLPIK